MYTTRVAQPGCWPQIAFLPWRNQNSEKGLRKLKHSHTCFIIVEKYFSKNYYRGFFKTHALICKMNQALKCFFFLNYIHNFFSLFYVIIYVTCWQCVCICVRIPKHNLKKSSVSHSSSCPYNSVLFFILLDFFFYLYCSVQYWCTYYTPSLFLCVNVYVRTYIYIHVWPFFAGAMYSCPLCAQAQRSFHSSRNPLANSADAIRLPIYTTTLCVLLYYFNPWYTADIH